MPVDLSAAAIRGVLKPSGARPAVFDASHWVSLKEVADRLGAGSTGKGARQLRDALRDQAAGGGVAGPASPPPTPAAAAAMPGGHLSVLTAAAIASLAQTL
eukprot:gene1096-1843_t